MKNISILIPHWKNGKATAYCISQLLKFKGDLALDILVCNNSVGDDSIAFLKPFENYIRVVDYPADKLQSHGLAFDYLLERGYVETEYFITIESDSFPESENWLSDIVSLIYKGYDCGGSLLQLSGGKFMHICGAFYKKSDWREAKNYCLDIRYYYLPNMAMRDGHASHLMVHKSIFKTFIKGPEEYIELSESYKPYSEKQVMEQWYRYLPIAIGPFHNGMGRLQESVWTYGMREPESELKNVLLDDRAKLIYRLGEEPGQWLHYFLLAKKRKCFYIPTQTKWMPGREMQQQEYTITESGFKHLWAGSSFLSMKDTAMHDVYEFKKNQIDELYNSLPENLKINQ